MNIFMLDKCPYQAARWHVDKHVVKMPLEAAQLLSTCHRVYDSEHKDLVYALSHRNHPSAVWVRECKENYDWTYLYFHALVLEYRFRYGKDHASWTKLSNILANAPSYMFSRGHMSTLPSCMPDIYKITGSSIEDPTYDPVVNYKQYYRLGKASLHKWTKREEPIWIW